jgi:hypothetical protein
MPNCWKRIAAPGDDFAPIDQLDPNWSNIVSPALNYVKDVFSGNRFWFSMYGGLAGTEEFTSIACDATSCLMAPCAPREDGPIWEKKSDRNHNCVTDG